MQYRIIVETEKSGREWFYIQYRYLGLFWRYLREIRDNSGNKYKVGYKTQEEANFQLEMHKLRERENQVRVIEKKEISKPTNEGISIIDSSENFEIQDLNDYLISALKFYGYTIDLKLAEIIFQVTKLIQEKGGDVNIKDLSKIKDSVQVFEEQPTITKEPTDIKQVNFEQMKNMSISKFGFSQRVMNVFEQLGIKQIKHIYEWSESKLYITRGLGKYSIIEIKEVLNKYNLPELP